MLKPGGKGVLLEVDMGDTCTGLSIDFHYFREVVVDSLYEDAFSKGFEHAGA